MIDYLTIAGVVVGGLIYTVVGFLRANDDIGFDWRYIVNQLIPVVVMTAIQLLQLASTTTIPGGFTGGFLFGITGKWATDSIISWKRIDAK